MPGYVWHAMHGRGAWIEPVPVAEWARLTRGYAVGQGRGLAPDLCKAPLVWVEPSCDVKAARKIALSAIQKG